jgi:hypothetical protein
MGSSYPKPHNAALVDPNMKKRLTELGVAVFAGSPADFGKFIADETEKWARWCERPISRQTDAVARSNIPERPFSENRSVRLCLPKRSKAALRPATGSQLAALVRVFGSH